MGRLCAALAFTLLALALAVGRAGADPTIAASLRLDPAPSWQSTEDRASNGAWVKHSSPVVADLGPVGRVILVGNLGGKLYALRFSGGSLTKVWAADVGTYIDSSPSVGDLNGDGCPEIAVGATGQRPQAGVYVFDCHGAKKWFRAAPHAELPDQVGVFSTPAIGDINGDRRPDVVYGSFNKKIYATDASGRDLPGWPRMNYDTVWSSPALADIDGNGRREVIIGTDLGGGAAVLGCAKSARGTMSIYDGAGRFTPNFPKCLDTPIWSTPAVQDLNGDDHLDVIVGTNNYIEGGKNVGNASVVRAWDTRTGRLLWQTQLASGTRVFASPAIGDVGANGSLDVAIGSLKGTSSGGVGYTYLLDARTGRIRWQKGAGAACVSACHFMGSPLIADVTGDGRPDVVANAQDSSLNAWDAVGSTVIEHFKPYHGYLFNNSPAVTDLDGDGTNEIVLAGGLSGESTRPGIVWVLRSSGRGAGPWPFFKRTVDRLASLGSGSRAVSSGGAQNAGTASVPSDAPPASGDSTAPARSTSRPNASATHRPHGTSDAADASLLPRPSAVPQASTEEAKPSRATFFIAAAMVLAAAGGAASFWTLRKRQASE